MDRVHGGVDFGIWPWDYLAEELAAPPLLHNLCSVPQILEPTA